MAHEEYLHESEQIFRAIFEQAGVGVAQTISASGRLIRVNQKYCELTGYSLEELKKLTIRDITHPDDVQENLDELDRMIRGETRGFTLEKRYLRKDGSVSWVNLTVSPLWKPGEEPYSHMAVVQDITERKLAELALTAALAEKEMLLRELNHRTKNNLQIMSSLIQIQATAGNDPRFYSLALSLENRIRSIALVHQMLYHSPNLSRVNLGDYARQLASHLKSGFMISPNQIEVEVLDSSPVSVAINTAIPCGQILNELISNAMKYAFPQERRGRISVQIGQQDDGEIMLRVSDDGVGLPPGFDAGASDTLGMTILHMLVGQLEGKITFQSGEGVTCEVRFTESV
jgi:PAS domain S-box-containing protein